MASRFGAGRGRHRKSRQRSCRGAGDHRVASGARRLAARRFIGGRRPPGPRARRVYEVVCQGLRCSWLPQRAGGPGVSTRSLERLLGEKNGSEDPPLQEKSGYKRRAATREERLQEKSGYKRRAATREERTASEGGPYGRWGNLQKGHGYRTIMRVREITLQEVRMKLVAPFETSVERTEVRRILLVQADVDGVIGWAECVAGESPSYSPETADTAWLMLREYLWPLIKGKDFAAASEVWD